METSFYSSNEIAAIGVIAHPTSLISKKASFYGGTRIHVGAYSRIDDFCVFSAGEGGIEIGRYVHVGAGSMLIGDGAITMADFSGLSGRVSIYSSSEDYSGAHMTNPTVPLNCRAVDTRPVKIGKHVIVGAGSIILPGTTLAEGAAIGALSLVAQDVPSWTLAAGQPARNIRERSKELLLLGRVDNVDSQIS
ncbi:MAG: acyltransferase [Aquidulcibacter sp.]|jgi:galactoside O-acetyltransferase|uniref:acyltransferase n=1 Tax=Aquidulcibacter sp. TaxID=2052990 RepID=UPI0022CBBA8C|nr:acyltransferase [Aquidulcibacter sp.]MCZ8209269.1 acyltransferase [Aquidulcibacter sp.]